MASPLSVSVESLATYAGIGDNGQENYRILKLQLGIIQHQTRSSGQSPIHYELAAKYTPALVEKFRAKNEVLSPSVTLLNVISHTPYFVRFLQSPAGQGITSLQARRTVEAASLIDSMPADEVGEIGQFLSTLLVLQGTGDVDEITKAALIPKLKQWQRRFSGTLASETCKRCIGQLQSDIPIQLMAKAMKNMLEKPLDCCGASGCEQKRRENDSDLMQCSRCKSAVYCGTDHQRKSWATHKILCFPTSF